MDDAGLKRADSDVALHDAPHGRVANCGILVLFNGAALLISNSYDPARFEFLAEAFEKVNMLGFLAGKLQKRARPVIVARELWPSVVDDVGKNEFFNQTEHGEIFMPADLIQRPFLLSRKKGERAHPCQGFRHEWLVEIKALLSADNIFDSPIIALGNFQSLFASLARMCPRTIGKCLCGFAASALHEPGYRANP